MMYFGKMLVAAYLLQLARWENDLNLDLEFIYCKYPQDVTSDIIQAIEDTLWDELKPMFGRKGKR